MNIYWFLFKETGKIVYYLKYKQIQRKEKCERSRGNNNKYNRL